MAFIPFGGTYVLNSLCHEVFSISRIPVSQECSFCRPRWKMPSISRRRRVNSGPWMPPKIGRSLCRPSSQRAN